MLLAILAFLSLLLVLWQWVVTLNFPLHRREGDGSFTPSVTVLKPLKGLDDNMMNCLRSWMTQDYPGSVQLLLGVASEADPACEMARSLIREHPETDARLIICGESLGVNGKVSTLIQLMRSAQHDLVVVSDADVLAPRDFLHHAIAPLREPEVGLVNCFYRLANPSTAAMHWEAIAINADFWSQVLQGRSLAPQDFALGAVMLTRRAELEAIGGFESLSDFLADDFQLGNRIARLAKKRVALCPVVVDCLSAPMSWREVWAHQLRWSRTIRVCKPLPYAFSILSNATFWPLLWAIAQPMRGSFITLVACLFVRAVMGQTLQFRLGAVKGQARFLWLAPVKDLLQFPLWALAFFGNDILWRGQRFRLQPGGRLTQD